MSRSEHLIAVLTKAREAAKSADGPDRHLPATSRAGRVRAVLAEIDETVLARALTFENGNDGHLVIEVRSRRAIRVSSIAPTGKEAVALRGALDAAETSAEAKVAALAGLIDHFCAPPGHLFVRSQPSMLPPSVIDKGAAPEQLEKALGPALEQTDDDTTGEPPPRGQAASPVGGTAARRRAGGKSARPARNGPTPVRAVAESAAISAKLSLLADAEGTAISMTGKGGSLPTKTLASSIAEAALTNEDALERALGEPCLVYLSRGGGTRESSLCYAFDGEEVAAAVLLPSSLKTISAAWRYTLAETS